MDDSKTLLKHCHCEFVKRQGGLSRSTGNEWGIRKGSQSINCEILRAGRSVGPAVCPLRVDRRGHFRGFDQSRRVCRIILRRPLISACSKVALQMSRCRLECTSFPCCHMWLSVGDTYIMLKAGVAQGLFQGNAPQKITQKSHVIQKQ